jgi:inner membrane protein
VKKFWPENELKIQPVPLIRSLTMNQVIIQGIGYTALLSVILSFQKNNRSKILLFLSFANILFIFHFSLLHAWTGVAMNVVGALRTILFYQKDTKVWAQQTIWMYVFMGAFILVGLITWTNYASLFPLLAGVTDTFALWKRSTKSIRFFMLIPRPLWFSYDFLVGSYAGMTTEVFVLASIIIGILRFDIPNKNSGRAALSSGWLKKSPKNEWQDLR